MKTIYFVFRARVVKIKIIQILLKKNWVIQILLFLFMEKNQKADNLSHSNSNLSENTNANAPSGSNDYIPENANHNSPSTSQNTGGNNSDGGYETDSNRSFWEEGVDAMAVHPVGEIPEVYLRQYIEETQDIVDNPELGSAVEDPELHQIWVDRNQELRDELRRREDVGMIAPSNSSGPGDNQGIVTANNSESNNNENEGSENNTAASSSSNKRKFEDDGESAGPSRSFQDSRDITNDTEPFDFCSSDD
jgi:hypothetical protein